MGVAGIQPRADVEVVVHRQEKSEFTITARCRIDTFNELEYFHAGGILPYVLRRLAA
jgi:aconitate hydratase